MTSKIAAVLAISLTVGSACVGERSSPLPFEAVRMAASATVLGSVAVGPPVFSPAVIVSPSARFAHSPDIAVDASGRVFVVWVERDIFGRVPHEVFFVRSTDGGSTFSVPLRFSHPLPLSAAPPRIAVSAHGTVYVFWGGTFEDPHGRQSQAYYIIRSDDHGETFGPSLALPELPAGAAKYGLGNARIATFGDRVYIAATAVLGASYEAVFNFSRDGGSTFGEYRNLSNTPAPQQSAGSLSLDVDAAGAIYVAWDDALPWDATSFRTASMLARSFDGGESFAPAKELPFRGMHIHDAMGAAGGGRLHVSGNAGGGSPWCVIAISADGGETFHVQNLFDGTCYSNAATPDGQTIYVSNLHALYMSDDGGTSFAGPFPFPGGRDVPVMVSDGERALYIARQDGNFDIAVSVGRRLLAVQIDIKPESDNNTVNSMSRGSVPVAIISSDDFDAVERVDASTLAFGRTGLERSLDRCGRGGEDVNRDGNLDLVCHFDTQRTELRAGDLEATLTGRTTDGRRISGKDRVRIIR